LNKCILIKNKNAVIIHNALITRKGKTKKGLLEYVHKRNKELVEGNNIILGTLDCNKPLNMSGKDVSKFISNDIEYAVYRNAYKIM
jgi:predicted GTPase